MHRNFLAFLSAFFLILLVSCLNEPTEVLGEKMKGLTVAGAENSNEIQPHSANRVLTMGFDFPVGKPDAKGYYNAQEFGKNNHLGDDWNAITGGDSDLGDPIYAISNGYVVEAKDHKGGWGNIIRIVHEMPNGRKVESLYAHCNEIFVQSGETVEKGDKIGTIGNAHGMYLAHLHLEVRDKVGMPLGGGYSQNSAGYLNPTLFIKSNR